METSLRVRDVGTWSRTSFGLTVIAGAPGSELSLGVLYDRARFDDGVIERLLEHLSNLLASMTASPAARLSELSLLGDSERRQVIAGFSSSTGQTAMPSSLLSLLEARVESTPERVAVSMAGVEVSYRELSRRADHLAGRLRGMGTGPDVAVAVCLERSPDAIVGILAILKAGGAYVPLDPEYPRDRISYIL
jgi:non-ribosomal peptide synthetase component F